MVLTVLKWERGVEITNGCHRGLASKISKTKFANDTEFSWLLLGEAILKFTEEIFQTEGQSTFKCTQTLGTGLEQSCEDGWFQPLYFVIFFLWICLNLSLKNYINMGDLHYSIEDALLNLQLWSGVERDSM